VNKAERSLLRNIMVVGVCVLIFGKSLKTIHSACKIVIRGVGCRFG
jgi:hypothetical protein